MKTLTSVRAKATGIVVSPDLHNRHKVAELERHRQLPAAGKLVETMYLVKWGKMTGTLEGAVCGVPSTVCPIAKCLLYCQHATAVARHWAMKHMCGIIIALFVRATRSWLRRRWYMYITIFTITTC